MKTRYWLRIALIYIVAMGIISLFTTCIILAIESADISELSYDVQDSSYIQDASILSQNEDEIIAESSSGEVPNDHTTDSVISADSKTISYEDEFLSTFGYIYEELISEESGLISGPVDRVTETWTNQQLEEYFGSDVLSSLDSMLAPLKRSVEDAHVILCADGTMWAGSNYVYTSGGVAGHVIIYFNKDSFDQAFELIYPIGQYNNTICGTDVWLGHIDLFVPPNQKPAAITDDLLLAAFKYNGVFYSVASHNLCETDHLRAIYAILNSTI